MSNTTISPWAKTFSSLIHRWGGLNASSFIYLMVIVSSLIISAAYHFIITGDLSLHDVMGTVIFASIISPVFIYGLINLITHLESILFVVRVIALGPAHRLAKKRVQVGPFDTDNHGLFALVADHDALANFFVDR